MSVDSAIRRRSAAGLGMLLALVLVPAVGASADDQYILLPKADGVVAPSQTTQTTPSQDPQTLAVVPDPPVPQDSPVPKDSPQGNSSQQSTLVPRPAPAVLPTATPGVVPPAYPAVPSVAPSLPSASSPTFLGVVDRILDLTGPGCCPTPSFGRHTMSHGTCLFDSQDINAPPPEYAPNFMGDLEVPPAYVLYSTNPLNAKYVPLPIAAGDGGFKISNNDNPVPTSRLFFEYDHATNALPDTSPGGLLNFDRYTLGIEQVLFWDSASVELRLPIAQGLISDLGPAQAAGTAFGNIPVVYKQVLWSDQGTFLSAGLAVVTPTAPEALINTPQGLSYVVRNESVHLGPFLGLLFKPDPRAFFEGFLQADFVTNGDAVFQNVGGTLTKLGVYQAQTLLSVDLKAGYWLYRGCESDILLGIAPSLEVHYTAALQDTDTAGPVTNPFNRTNVVNLTAGLHVEFDHGTDLSVGVSLPLSRINGDRPDDNEVLVQLNQRY